MKKRFIASLTLACAVIFLTGFGQAQDIMPKFSLKMTGGYGTMKVGDLNAFIETLDTYLSDIADLWDISKEGEGKKINMGLEFEGEFMLKLMKSFGIAIGAGYIMRSSESTLSIYDAAARETYIFKPEVKAIPVNLGIYFFSSILPSTDLYLNGGVSYYFGKGKSALRSEYEEAGEIQGWSESVGNIKDKGIGFFGGIGLEFNFGPALSLFVEGKGRYCKLNNWSGDETYTYYDGFSDTNSGTMWYYEFYDDELGKWYPFLTMMDEEPSGTDIRNVRKFEADLSGFSLRAGFKIKF